jgi:hypothetical protein
MRPLLVVAIKVHNATRRSMIMPNWVGPLLVFCALVGFIVFAFRQGTKVKPGHNPDNSVGGGGGDASHGGDGH